MDHTAFDGVRPVGPRHGFDLGPVERFLLDKVPGFVGPIEIAQFKGGQSNPTFLMSSPSGRYVLRRKPYGPVLRTAHAVDREFRVTRALHAAGFPVACPLAFCDDPAVMPTPFFVMEFVEGRVFWDSRLPQLPLRDRRAVYHAAGRALAHLHGIDVVAAGLSDYGRPGDYFRRQVQRWTEQYERSRTRPLASMDALVTWLSGHPPRPSGRSAVIHGDFRLDNIIFASGDAQVMAVIDWELSTLGDPLADLSYQCMVWRLPRGVFGSLAGEDLELLGIPSEAEYVAAYLAQTGATRPEDWDAYLVFNMFRLAAILEGVARRAIDGSAASAHALAMAGHVEPIADAAWEIARAL
jgi:aminoglycoside phosphotransferase (APT) family kinase protein